jgi:transposase
MKRSIVLGVDIAKKSFDVCLRQAGLPDRQAVFSNDAKGIAELLKWVGPVKAARVGIEATGSYWQALAAELHGKRWRVYVLNPAYVKGHGQSRGRRSKTDRSDAALVADYVWRNADGCVEWEPLAPELEELRELTRLYHDVTNAAASLGQRREGLRTARAQALLEEIAARVKDFAKEIRKEARAHARKHPSLDQAVRCLESIKGVGEVTALAMVAELPRKRTARSVACWAGLTPREYESGTSLRKAPKVCKQGSEYVRTLLYWPAIAALRFNPAMQQFGRRMEQSGHNKMQIIGAAMHKLLRWCVGVLNSGRPFDSSLHAIA